MFGAHGTIEAQASYKATKPDLVQQLRALHEPYLLNINYHTNELLELSSLSLQICWVWFQSACNQKI